MRLRGLVSWRRLTSASAVLIGSAVTINVLRIVNSMLLTRLLSPRDFGIVGIILSIFLVVNMLTDAGFEAYIVRHEKGEDPYFLDAIWTIHLLRGIANAAIAMALAWPLGLLLAKPALAPLLAASALTIAIDGAASLSLLTALRQKLVRRLSIVDLVAFLGQLAIGIVAAWLLRNAWALVISMIGYSLLRTGASYAVFPAARRRFRFDRALTAELWRFSRIIGASSILTLVMSQTDKFVFARAFTLVEFGIYAIAANLAGAPTAIVALYTSRILYPALAEAWRLDPGSIRRRYYELRGLVFYGYLFASGGLIGCAPLLIRILYDPRYAGAGRWLQLLALSTGAAMLTRSSNEMLVAIGRTATTLSANFVRIAWLGIAGMIGFVVFGPIGLVATVALMEPVAWAYYLLVMRRLHLLDLGVEMRAVLVIAAGAAVGFGVDLLGLRLLP